MENTEGIMLMVNSIHLLGLAVYISAIIWGAIYLLASKSEMERKHKILRVITYHLFVVVLIMDFLRSINCLLLSIPDSILLILTFMFGYLVLGNVLDYIEQR